MSDAVSCVHCGHGNPGDARFCGACGRPLEARCPACGSSNPATNRFCHRCGAAISAATAPAFDAPESYTPKHLVDKILSARGALEGERKQVTVLFVDVSGFTSLSEQLDPEDVHRLMSRAFELMLDEVHRYEGTVNQFLGDGIMALFGAPIAHEDHARRAVHAALGIRGALAALGAEARQRLGMEFTVRQGLNTGLVVVGTIGNDLRMDYTAVGDTTNVAARLLQQAERGRVLVSDATHRLVEGYFETRPLGQATLKGRAAPVPVFEVVAARAPRSRLAVASERGLTPYVGRAREIQTLLDAFEAARGGHGQMVFVVGEPGIGKSRLLHEFRARLADAATWLEGAAISFGGAIAFHPVIDMLRRWFGIDEHDSESAIAAKIEAAVADLGADVGDTVPYLRTLLSIDPGDPAVAAMDPRRRRGEIVASLRRLLIRAAERRCVVLVWEDAHWMDKATEDALRAVGDSVPANRMLQIFTYRPGYAQPFGERTYHTRIALGALSGDDSVDMAVSMLATPRLPAGLEDVLVRKAEGNPFFVEEVIKSLLELGVLRREGERYVLARRLEEVSIPDTIQGVIMARIDRLDEAPKRTLQLASVIGREFTRRLLDRIGDLRDRSDDLLRELKNVELIYETALFPELAYMFKHALTHDVAYGSLLVQRRRELHRTIALAIEELYADRLAEQYEVLAHHFTRAEEWERAFEYLQRAAEKAGRAFAVREAVTLCTQALDVAEKLGDGVPPARRMALVRAKSQHLFAVGDFVEARPEAERLLALARATGDRSAEASALAWLGFVSQWALDLEAALAYAGEAVAAAEATGVETARGLGYLTTGYVVALGGEVDEGRSALDTAVAISGAAGDAATQSLAMQLTAFIDGWQGDWQSANARAIRALEIARSQPLIATLIRALWARGIVLTGKGDYDAALTAYDEGLALAEKVGDANTMPRYLNSIAWLLAECGHYERALEIIPRAVEGARRWRHAVGVEIDAYCQVVGADMFLDTGDVVLAREFLDHAERIVADPATKEWMKWRYTMHLWVSLGEYWLTSGQPARAAELAARAATIAARTNARKYLVRIRRLQADIARTLGRWDEATRAMAAALETARDIGNPPQLWRTLAARARLLDARGDVAGTREAWRDAQAAVDAVRATVRRPELSAGFERSPLIAAIYGERPR
jgi:class 3 adenylate cyclase/tetratricopeptide (TPR) repeat protein